VSAVERRSATGFVDNRISPLLAFKKSLICRELEGVERELAGT
jgi:hypothetical protein